MRVLRYRSSRFGLPTLRSPTGSVTQPCLHRSHLRIRNDPPRLVATWRLCFAQVRLQGVDKRGPPGKRKGPLTCTYVVAGAGFEPATFGL